MVTITCMRGTMRYLLAFSLMFGQSVRATALDVPVQARTTQQGGAWLGIAITEGQPPVIRAVAPGSPAERAGLQIGETLVSIDGKPASASRLDSVTKGLKPGTAVTLRLERATVARVVTVMAAPLLYKPADTNPGQAQSFDTLAAPIHRSAMRYLSQACEGIEEFRVSPSDTGGVPGARTRIVIPAGCFDAARKQNVTAIRRSNGTRLIPLNDLSGWIVAWGMEATSVTPALAEYLPGVRTGVLVLQTIPSMSAGAAGVRPGDVIVAVDRTSVATVDDVDAFADGTPKQHTIDVVRKGTVLRLTLVAKTVRGVR